MDQNGRYTLWTIGITVVPPVVVAIGAGDRGGQLLK